jgi:3-oxoacyl-(acyl-carrier-protein) synthase
MDVRDALRIANLSESDVELMEAFLHSVAIGDKEELVHLQQLLAKSQRMLPLMQQRARSHAP